MHARKQQTSFYQEDEQFLSHSYSSKEEFFEEYKKIYHVKSRAKELYFVVVAELEKAILEGNVDNFKRFSESVHHIIDIESPTLLKTYYNDKDHPTKETNLVILVCKHNKIEILKYIFSGRVFKNVSILAGKNAILPDDKDETSHDVFYYAIRSGNTEILDILIDKWPGSYFASRTLELDEVLSRAYDRLMLQNVSLSDEMEIFVENKLLNLRFFSDPPGYVRSAQDSRHCISERIELVLKYIALLKCEYSNNEEVDAKFLLVGKFIAQNIHVLKRQLKVTYDRLPWEEMEFCLVVFMSSHLKRQEINLFYRIVLDKSKILSYLESFANALKDLKPLLKSLDGSKLANLPKSNRELVVSKIIRDDPRFSELYNDYQQLRDIYSLKRVGDYLNLALSADPKEREGQIIITRTLQVIGEYFKNTLESPNLSSTTSELLLLSLPKNTRKVIADLRNSLSHVHSLSKRDEIYESTGLDFFIGVQNDIKRIDNVITEILHNNMIRMIEILLKKIINTKSLDEMKTLAEIMSGVKPENVITHEFNMRELEKIEKLIQQFSEAIKNQTNFEKGLFNQINSTISSAKTKSDTIKDDYSFALTLVRSLSVVNEGLLFTDDSIKAAKFHANLILEKCIPRMESHSLKEIAELSMGIHHSALSRIQDDTIDTIKRLAYEIIYIAEFEINDIKWVEKLKKMLNQKNSSTLVPKGSKTRYIPKDKCEYEKQLTAKLSELENVLVKDSPNDKLIDNKKNKKLQAVVEMLVLDIMSILGGLDKYLENNIFFLDDYTPLLIGKSLRNYLAHGNVLIDVLLDPSLAVILNAEKLVSENVARSVKKVGKVVEDDPSELNLRFDQDLAYIINQEKMFAALLNGSLEELKIYLDRGADINAKSINLSTTLHFAAQGPNLELVKCIVDQNVSINAKDKNGRTPLHVAAAYGRKNTIKFFLTKAIVPVDDPDQHGKTPLHLAAENGHTDTVEILLKNNAPTDIKASTGNSPLHYAVGNNHVEVAKILLKKESNVDVNKTASGFTPLHIAAECGHLEIVDFLLKNGAKVDTKNYTNGVPLHPAALNGHLKVVKALILKGANVNMKTAYGCTALHFAVENGHVEVAEILLEHGAEVDVSDTTYNNTPLHYAAKDGHEQIIEILLKKKANADITAKAGITPLHLAARNGHLQIVASLLKYGVDIHARDFCWYTAIHHASKHGHKEISQVLIQKGSKVNAKAFNNSTPLHLAALEGHEHVVDLLIKNGADIFNRDIMGNTPLLDAAKNGHKGVIDILLKNKASVDSRSLHEAALGGYYDVSVFLLEHDADVNAKDECGLTPLNGAILNGHKEIVNLLIENGAQVDTVSPLFPMTPLSVAVEAGHKEIVEILIASGAKVDAESNHGSTLISAIENNNKEMVEVLIANGADVNADRGRPLTTAVLSGYQDIVKLLLKHHARVDIKGPENVTPLHLAAGKGRVEIVKALLSKGANVNAMSTIWATPLSFAAETGQAEVAEILIAHGVNINDKMSTPLHVAAAQGHADVVSILLRNGANAELLDMEYRKALQLAVQYSHLPVVKLFMQHKKVNLEDRGTDGVTLLLISAQENNLEMVKYLVGKGCNIHAKNVKGSKCTHIAAREGLKDIVEFFLAKGMDVNEPGARGHTPLHYTAVNDQVEVAKYLLTKGARVNARDDNKCTPLHVAVNYNASGVIEVLLKNGAVFNAMNIIGQTPLTGARDKHTIFGDKKKIIELLSSTENLFDAVKRNSSSDVEKFIKRGALINAKNDGNEATPLHYAACKGYKDVANILLQNKADPNAVCDKGYTALHYAAKFSRLGCVKILMCHGATYNAVSETGKTPLNMAKDKSIIDFFKIVDESFEKIRINNARVIDDLNKVNNEDLKAIMNARNRRNQCLIAAVSQSNFELAEQLKLISQGDVLFQLIEATSLLNQGYYQRSLSIFKRLVERRRQLLGSDNPATLEMQVYVGKALYKEGSYHEALDMFERILCKQKEILGLDSKDTLDTRSAIALVLHRLGKNDEAFDIFQAVYPKQKEILGPNHQDTVNTYFHMALALEQLGKYEEALNINRAVLKIREKTLGPGHINTIMAQNNIASVYSHQGKHEEAIKMYKEVLERKKEIVGINHADTLRTMQSIANVLLKQNKLQESLKAYEEVLNIMKKTLQQNHPEILNTQCNIAEILFAQGNYVRAYKFYKECHDQRVKVFGPTHPSVLYVQMKMEEFNKCKFKLGGPAPWENLHYLQTEINIASSKGDIRNVEYLMESGADVDDANNDGRTPLHFAVSNGHLDLVNFLLKNGADVTLVTNKGNTPLHTAASKNYKEIIQVLLQHVDKDKLQNFVNAKTTSGGTTSLHVAAKAGYLEIVRLLLKNGATYEIPNKEGKTPVNLATDQKTIELFKLIDEMFKLVKKGNVEAIDKLKTVEPDEFTIVTNARCNRGHGLLQVAIINKHKNIAAALLTMLKKPN